MKKCLRLEVKFDEEVVNEWLLKQSSERGFKQYFKKRDWVLLKHMGMGVDEKQYWKLVGQREELLLLLGSVNNAEDKNEQRRKKENIT